MTTWSHDQFWWRNADGWRTTVTLWGGWLRPLDHAVPIDCRVYDTAGRQIDAWQQFIDPAWGVIIESSTRPVEVLDGTLVVVVDEEHVDTAPTSRGSLYGLVDWHHADGRLACLHSDHVPNAKRPVDLTEIISNFDLAMIQMTRDTRSGAIGFEHLMAGRSLGDGGSFSMAGG